VKQLWQRYVQKVDGISLRERVMVFAVLAALLIFVLDAALISPQLAKQKRLSREVAQRQGEIKKMQEQLQQAALARQANPDEAIRRQLESLRQRIAETEAKLADEQRKFVPPEQVGALLDQMLSRNKRLQLVDMRTLPVANLADPVPAPGEAAKPAAPKPAAAAEKSAAVAEKPAAAKPAAKPPSAGSQIYRHGVEITLSGNYLDLLAYLRDLEKLPTQLYWGRVELGAAAPPLVTLKLSVYTLSLDLSWLVV